MHTLGEALPLLAAPRLGSDERGCLRPDIVGRHQLAGGEDANFVEVVGRPLIVHAEAGEAVDLVAPQVDADRCVGGRGEHVDDRAAPGELAAVLHELFASVAEFDEPSAESVGIDVVARSHDDRLGRDCAGAELLHERPDASDDDRRAALGVAEAPQDVEALTHGLHARAHPFEWEGLPAGEVHDIAGREELGKVVGELAGHGARRAADHERAARRQPRERCDRDRTRHFDHGEPRLGVAECPRQPRLVAQHRRQLAQCAHRHHQVSHRSHPARHPRKIPRSLR